MGLEILKSVLASAWVVVAAVPAFAQQEPTGSWAAESGGTNLSSPYGGSASDGTYLYIFGGYQYGASFSYPGYYATTRRYDPVSNQWTTLGVPLKCFAKAGADMTKLESVLHLETAGKLQLSVSRVALGASNEAAHVLDCAR